MRNSYNLELKDLSKNTTCLDLRQTNMTDEDLKSLLELKNLELLDISSTKVTNIGLNWLTKYMPKCKVIN